MQSSSISFFIDLSKVVFSEGSVASACWANRQIRAVFSSMRSLIFGDLSSVCVDSAAMPSICTPAGDRVKVFVSGNTLI